MSRASQEAIETVERLGGKVVCAYYNKLGLRVLLKPEKFEGGQVMELFSKRTCVYCILYMMRRKGNPP